MEINPSVLAENIKNYLSQGKSLEEIHLSAQQLGISEALWNEAINIVQPKTPKPSWLKSSKKVLLKWLALFLLIVGVGVAGLVYLKNNQPTQNEETMIILEDRTEEETEDREAVLDEASDKVVDLGTVADDQAEDFIEMGNSAEEVVLVDEPEELGVLEPSAEDPATLLAETEDSNTQEETPVVKDSDFEIKVASDKDHSIGNGMDWIFTEEDTKIMFGLISEASISISLESKLGYFSFDFSSAKGSTLLPGLYSPAKRNSSRESYNGIDFSGASKGCNRVFGGFYVHEYVETDGVLDNLAIDFVHACDTRINERLYGSLRYNSDIKNSCDENGCQTVKDLVIIDAQITTEVTLMPVDPLFGLITKSTPNDPVAKGDSWGFDNEQEKINVVTALPDSVRFSIENKEGDNPSPKSTSVDLTFSSASGTTLSPGLYAPARRDGFRQSYNGIEVNGNGRGCNKILGAFYVHEYEETNEVLQKAAIDFLQSCEEDDGALSGKMYGSLRYNSEIKNSCDSEGCVGVSDFIPEIFAKIPVSEELMSTENSFQIDMASNVSNDLIPHKFLPFSPERGSEISITKFSPEMVVFEVKDFEISSYLDFRFSSPQGKVLDPGLYSPAQNATHPNEYNVIKIYGNARASCREGAFYVHEYELSEDKLEKAAIDFLQRCEKDRNGLAKEHYGSFRYNSDIPSLCDENGSCQKVKDTVLVNSPENMVPSIATDNPQFKIIAEVITDDSESEVLSFASADNLKLKPMNVSDSNINFNLEPFFQKSSYFQFRDLENKLTKGWHSSGDSNLGGIRVSFGAIDSRCSVDIGDFYVHEYVVEGKELQKAAIEFVQFCDEKKENIYGSLRYGSSIPLGCNAEGCQKIKKARGL